MKQRLIFFFFCLVSQSFGQVQVTITPGGDTTLCSHDTFAIVTQVTGTGPFTYQWLKYGNVIPNKSDSILAFSKIQPADTGIYSCIVSNGTFLDTSNICHVKMYPAMKIDTLYRYNDLGCPGTSKGQYKVKVSGGAPPYIYNWPGGHSQDTLVFGLGEGIHHFIVSDTNHCSLDTTYDVKVLVVPEVEIVFQPKDTLYLSKPTLTVSIPDTSLKHMVNWTWNFGDTTDEVPNLNPVSHTYKKNWHYEVTLKFTDKNGCEATAQKTIIIKIAELKIPNVFTPDHDPGNLNETFMITLVDAPSTNFDEAYLSNELVIIDRWGKTVYSKVNYSSNNSSGEWTGEKLSDGQYFYLLKVHGQYSDEVYKGTVTILRYH